MDYVFHKGEDLLHKVKQNLNEQSQYAYCECSTLIAICGRVSDEGRVTYKEMPFNGFLEGSPTRGPKPREGDPLDQPVGTVQPEAFVTV